MAPGNNAQIVNGTPKVLAIVGMGPKLGMAVARRFGREGYRLGLVSRNFDRLAGYTAELKRDDIEAACFPADVCDRQQLKSALAHMKKRLGRIDVLEYSPMIDVTNLRSAIETTPESVMPLMDHVVYGAIAAAECVMDDMVARRDGALLFTSGLSAVVPLPSHTNVSVAMAGLHRYVQSLNVTLADSGVYAGNFVIGELRPPAAYADILWEMATKREGAERVIGDPVPLAAFETLVARGYAQPHPARLIKPLPDPRDDNERDTLLRALVHAHMTAASFEDEAPRVRANVEAEVAKLGGDTQAPYFGAKSHA
jgi:NADP-dependent 3-hydroxy acid dehydrogenase YdfG